MNDAVDLIDTDDLRIAGITEVSSPSQIRRDLPITPLASQTVSASRAVMHDILHGKDDRVFVVVGPCSIHDPKAALDYAQRLLPLRKELGDRLEIVMRVYFEKPRTTVGWKGLINDPDMDGSFKINKGLKLARDLLLQLNNMEIPAATEYLDPISPQYVADLISWGAIGARTTESQVHRELASGLSCPIGFKNGTNGNLQIAIDAIGASSRPHNFLSVTKGGRSAIVLTSGNEDCHVILRGGSNEPNYSSKHVRAAAERLEEAGLAARLMVDCSHANTSKDHNKLVGVSEDLAAQIAAGENAVVGIMIESNLEAGRQDMKDPANLKYGVSVTDACLAWDDTEPLLRKLADAVAQRRSI